MELRDIGNPALLAARYEAEGADEIVFLDISASAEGRATLLETVRATAEQLFIPLTVGGGVRTADDVGRVLRAGADKVAINSAAVARPTLLTESADRFGAQCIVASIDARREGDRWLVWTHGARTRTERDAVAWAQECVALGAGEILLTSIDHDGARTGFDLALTRAVADAVAVPVIASGGAGKPAHLVAALEHAHADAVLIAGIVHDGVHTVRACKAAIREAGLLVRATA